VTFEFRPEFVAVSMKSTDAQMPVPLFKIGGELLVNRIGFGAMRLTGQPGNWGPYADWEHGVRVLREAVELGCNFIDTADAYGPGDNESLIADALHPYSASVVIASKGATVKTAPGQYHANGQPEYLKSACDASLTRLRRDSIDLYQLHRVDPEVPIEESVGALVELQSAGKIRHIGLSNVTIEQVQAAGQVTAISSVQNRYNLLDRRDEAMLKHCEERGIAYLPYSPLGAPPMERVAALANQGHGPLALIAAHHRRKPAQIALAWLLYHQPNVIPIPGTTSLIHLLENVKSLHVRLTLDEVAELDKLASP
jgi:aryl-alcohol dehydrogenase-like predicted oxidoreductase